MRIGSETEHVDFVVLESSPAGSPINGSIRVGVTVTLREFCGAYNSVWLERAALDEFMQSMDSLERTRSGKAVLRSMSPDELVLCLRSRDSFGHLVTEISLQRHQYSGPTYWPTRVSGGFELEPSELPNVVSQFKILASG